MTGHFDEQSQNAPDGPGGGGYNLRYFTAVNTAEIGHVGISYRNLYYTVRTEYVL